MNTGLSKKYRQVLLAVNVGEEVMNVLVEASQGEIDNEFVDFVIAQALVPEISDIEFFKTLIPRIKPSLRYNGRTLGNEDALKYIFEQVHENRGEDKVTVDFGGVSLKSDVLAELKIGIEKGKDDEEIQYLGNLPDSEVLKEKYRHRNESTHMLGGASFTFSDLTNRTNEIAEERRQDKGFSLDDDRIMKFQSVVLSMASKPVENVDLDQGEWLFKDNWTYNGVDFYFNGEKKEFKVSGSHLDMINTCLINDDISSLDDCLSKHGIENLDEFAFMKKENTFHPLIVIRILEKFGFQAVNNGGKREVQSINDWYNNVVSVKMGDTTLKRIMESKNSVLLNILGAYVQWVNKNSGILNYSGAQPNQKQLLPLYSMRDVISSLKQKLQTDKHMLGFNQYQLFGLPFLPFMSTSPEVILQGGGGMEQSGARYMKEIFDNAFEELKDNNKEIVLEDKERILKRLNNVISEEDEIVKNLNIIKAFSQLRNAFEGYNSDILTQKNMDKLVKRQQKLEKHKNKQEGDLVNILETMSKL